MATDTNATDINLAATVPDALSGKRLDQVAATLFPDYSRGRLQTWIKDGCLTVDGRLEKPKAKLCGGEILRVAAEVQPEGDWEPEPLDLTIVYQDEDIIVINKPANLVVHPAAGNRSGTLLNGLLYEFPELASLPRAGIVHRLDKDTTGLMVVARNLRAHASLVNQLQEKTVQRSYQAVVMGAMTGGGQVNQPIARHPSARTKMAVHEQGKPAVTHYRLIKRYQHFTHIDVQLETGRTHQIRVHMAYLHYPLVGDPVYGGRMRIPPAAPEHLIQSIRAFSRQALHAYRLGLCHPGSGESVEWSAALPNDFQTLLDVLGETDA